MSRLVALFAVAVAAVFCLPGLALGEQAGSRDRSFQAGLIAAGDGHSCAVVGGGSASCWGLDGAGQLGDDPLLVAAPSPVAVALPAGTRAVAIGAGGSHSCALLDDGSVSCWGDDTFGQLGDDALLAQKPTPVAVALPAGRRAVAISTGSSHACAVLDDGSAVCWGDDSFGQLGDSPTLAGQPTPVLVALPAGRRATAISTGGFHSCALLDDGSASCWGGDISGQLGDDANLAQMPTPVAVVLPAGRRAIAISAGGVHGCAVLDDGSAVCWGSDVQGGLGDDALLASKGTPVPVALPAGRRVVAISAGGSHTCAALDDGSLACWGRDIEGQLGDDVTLADKPTPVMAALPVDRRVVAVSSGRFHTCAVLDDGSGRCWGSDTNGKLGNGLDGAQQPVVKDAPAAFAPGSMAGRAVDLSVTIEGAPAQLAVGASSQAVIRLVNRGPDQATGVRVLLGGTRLVLEPVSIGQGALAGGFWQVGTLGPGTDAVAVLAVTALAAGTATVSAEVAAQAERDIDSTPANGTAGEDDQAEAAITIIAPPSPTPPPAASKAAPERLTLNIFPARDTSAPHKTTATGRLVATGVSDRTACIGSVTITAMSGKKTLRAKTAKLKLVDGACQYGTAIAVSGKQRGTARTAKLIARFGGNEALLPVTSRARTLRFR